MNGASNPPPVCVVSVGSTDPRSCGFGSGLVSSEPCLLPLCTRGLRRGGAEGRHGAPGEAAPPADLCPHPPADRRLPQALVHHGRPQAHVLQGPAGKARRGP